MVRIATMNSTIPMTTSAVASTAAMQIARIPYRDDGAWLAVTSLAFDISVLEVGHDEGESSIEVKSTDEIVSL